MKRRTFMQFGLGLAAGAGAARARGELQWATRILTAMGTAMTFKVAHPDGAVAERALDAAVADMRHLEEQMSLFRTDSAICELNRTGVLRNPHPDLLELLRIAQQVSRRSQGAFDITVQPLWQGFDAAKRQGRLPSEAEIARARARVDWRRLQVSPEAIRLRHDGMGITLNGIAQGYAADKVRARLRSMGIAHALVNAGEWAALGQPAHRGDWTLGIADPRQPQELITRVPLQGRCLASSADDQCSFSPDFVHHHILDPHTGYSPPALASVSVLAQRCVIADALTKVFFVAGYAQSLALAKAWGVDVVVVDKQGRWQASPGLL